MAKLANMASWGSAAEGPIQSLISTTLEDLAVVMEANSKRRIEEEAGGDKKVLPKKFIGNGWAFSDHFAKPSHRLQDAAQAIVYTLEEWVKPHPAGESPHGFALGELREIHAWVALLADAFPGKEEGGPDLHQELLELRDKLQARVQLVQGAAGHGALCVDEPRPFQYGNGSTSMRYVGDC